MKFIHTADWQLGLKLRYINPERAAHLRLQRFNTIKKIAALAIEKKVDFVVVCGDAIDDNGVGPDTQQWTCDVLADFGAIPVYIIPGNHDAATEDCVLTRMKMPANVTVLTKREPVQVRGGSLYPCPLVRRHESEDPTKWLPERSPHSEIMVALAHGGVINFAQDDSETPNLIDANAIIEKGYDYLALGDWHGTLRYNDRVWYSGAHEATRFKEADPGNVLLVEIEAAGAQPKVERVPVADVSWLTWDIEFVADAQVQELRTRIESTPKLASTLLLLRTSGSLSLSALDQLDRLVEEFSGRLANLRHETTVVSAPTEEDLTRMAGEGFVGAAIQHLRTTQGEHNDGAIRLLYRLQQEVANAPA